MPSGSKKEDYTPEQYEKQLGHSQSWKDKNKEHIRLYNKKYNERRRREKERERAAS